MAKGVNLLVTAAGRRVPIIRELKKALTNSSKDSKLICVDIDPLSPGLYLADKYFLIPKASDKAYVPELLGVCLKEQVSIVIPTTDEELLVLAQVQEQFLEQGIRIIISPYPAIQICADKLLTYQFLRDHGFPAPRTYTPEQLIHLENLSFPLFIKPRDGKGSINAYKLNNLEELNHYLPRVAKPIIQEFCLGTEFTVDAMCDISGEVIIVVPRERISTIGGVSQKGRTTRNPQLEQLTARICRALNLVGPVNIQFFANGEQVSCIEINPRLSGGIPLTLAAGADFAGMLVEMARGNKLVPALGQFTENLVMLRYDESIFLKEERGQYVRCNPL